MKNLIKEKRQIEKRIYSNQRISNPFKWVDIKHIKFEDNDEISIGWEEEYYSENESHDGYYYVRVTRMVIETDEEYQKRLDSEDLANERRRKLRYENYLNLKKEFENN